jgi:hypothetical protein
MVEGYLLRDGGGKVFDVRLGESSMFLRRISDGLTFKVSIDAVCSDEFPEYGELTDCDVA